MLYKGEPTLKLRILYLFVFLLIVSGLSNQSFSSTLPPNDEEYILVAEKSAVPVGGIDGLTKKVLAETSLKGKGKLYLLVYVNATGGVDEVKVVKGFGGEESAAVSIVEKSKFTPAMNNNAPVKSKIAIALNLN